MADRHGPVPAFPIRDKIVLITGGASGIGLAFAQHCHSRGARILIADLKPSPEATTFISSSPSTIIFTTCDVTSWSDLNTLISTSLKHFSSVPDIYIPSAGVFEPLWSNFWSDGEDSTYKLLEINTHHPIKLTRIAMRALASAGKRGVVCLVSSTAGFRANYHACLYAASKHAVLGFAKSMAEADERQGVKVVCVCPGTVLSPLWTERGEGDGMMEEVKLEQREKLLPGDVAECMGRMVEGEEYEGGTCVLKTPFEERVFERGWRGKGEEYDPSPRPEPDMRRIEGILQAERGVSWKT